MTNSDSTKAYVYYDVLNQYGESIRTSESVEWTVSGSKTVDKASGKITVTKSDNTAFTYGTQIYVTGVHVKSGKSVTKVVTTGMAQSVDSIKFEGFVSKNDKTKKLTELPKDFAKNTYYLIYKTYDQNGNALDVNDDDYTYKNLTFICDSPLVLELNTKDAKVFTIGDDEYAAIAVNPGQYIDKGGEVNITAISNKTGKSTTQNYVIGAAGLLKSFVLSAPANTVADGDTSVEIPYTAKDTEGNTITNYETIVRSTNKLTLTASDETSLVVKEKNDGTAVVLWSDNTKEHSATNFAASSASDEVNRNISLTTVVVGGESNNMMMEVSDTRRPTAIKSIKLNDDNNDTIVNGNTAAPTYLSGKDNQIVFLDQYGAELAGAKATAFFEYAGTTGFGKNGDSAKYGIKVDASETNSLGLAKSNTYTTEGKIVVAANLADTSNCAVDTVKYSIAKYDSSSKEYVDVSKVKSVAYTIVPVNKVQNYTISGLNGKLEIATDLSGKDNGESVKEAKENDAAVTGTLATQNNVDGYNEFKVQGTYDGKTVTLPSTVYDVTTDSATVSGSAFTISKSGEKSEVKAVTAGALKWSELYNFNAYASPRKDAEKVLKLTITKENGSVEPLDKTVAVSDEPAAAAAINFIKDYQGVQKEGIIYPDMTVIDGSTISSGYDDSWAGHLDNTIVRICGNQWAHNNTLLLCVTDQYGRTYSADNSKITFTVSDVKENTSETAHVANNFTVNKNGTLNANIEGAEIGDTFTLTAKVAGTKLSASVKMTVAADKAAYIDQNGDGSKSSTDKTGNKISGSKDKGLRELLGYDR